MREVGVLFDADDRVICWHVPAERTSTTLPDSAPLWNNIWRRRHDVAGFAHSHPGTGVPLPSKTDCTTFAAIEAALGRRLIWPIITQNRISVCCWVGPQHDRYLAAIQWAEPPWVRALRSLSGQPLG